jgi:hypothetical protein
MSFEIYESKLVTGVTAIRLNRYKAATIAVIGDKIHNTRLYVNPSIGNFSFVGWGYDPDDAKDFKRALHRAYRYCSFHFTIYSRFEKSVVGMVNLGYTRDIVLDTTKPGMIALRQVDVQDITERIKFMRQRYHHRHS